MSPPPTELAPDAIQSRYFAHDDDVLAATVSREGVPMPPLAFAAPVWDFSQLPDAQRALTPAKLRFDFSRIEAPSLRLGVREAAMAYMRPDHPAVVEHVLHPVTKPTSPSGICGSLQNWLRLSRWLTQQQIYNFEDVDQEVCQAYLNVVAPTNAPRSQTVVVVQPLRALARMREVMTEPTPVGLGPWGRTPPHRITGGRRPDENVTPVVPDAVFDPLLAGALFLVEHAHDLLSARAELRGLMARPLKGIGPVADRLQDVVNEARAAGHGIPVHSGGRYRSLGEVDDSLTVVNWQLLSRRVGSHMKMQHLSSRSREVLLAALQELGPDEGVLWSPRAVVTRADGSQGPWHPAWSPETLHVALRRLGFACALVLLALAAIRQTELFEMEHGASWTEEVEPGLFRRRLRTYQMKAKRHGGTAAVYTIIDAAGAAVRVLELMRDDKPGPLLDAQSFQVLSDSQGRGLKLDRAFGPYVGWHNSICQQAGLPPIGLVDGKPWEFDTRQLRRTCLVAISQRRHGLIAAKVHAKHVAVTITESYIGTAGRSSGEVLGMLNEIEEEHRLAQELADYRQFCEEDKLAGPHARAQRERFERVRQEEVAFPGSVQARDEHVRNLLRSSSSLLHVGLYNDCHFVDAHQAHCLKHLDDPTTAEGPLLNQCAPDRCPGSGLERRHAASWAREEADLDERLSDPRLPPVQRRRLKVQRDRARRMRATAEGEQL